MGEEHRTTYYQQRLAPGEFLYDDSHLKKLYEQDTINTQYIHSIFCEEYEKNMLDAIAQKQVMNGSVPEILMKPK